LKAFILVNFVGYMPFAVSGELPEIPNIYNNGPILLQLPATNLSPSEIAANALYEGVMQMAESQILATSCSSAAETYTFNIYANGVPGAPELNEIKVLSPGDSESFILRAEIDTPDASRGQTFRVNQVGSGMLKGTEINDYQSDGSIDKAGTLMVLESSMKVMGVNNTFDLFQSKIIKDFYRDPNINNVRNLDWGLQSISKLDHPQNKYWQRSISRKDDGVVGRTVFVKDRLVGSSPCRIVVDGTGSNNQDFLSQSGTLTISTESPNDPIPAFDAF
jgi:hypothetical protein